MHEIGILCHSKDCNRDVTLQWIESAFRHLDLQDYPLYVSTENIPIGVGKSIVTGDGLWSTRLRKALEEVDCKHILFFLEDMIIKKVDTFAMQLVVSWHISNGNDVTKFGNNPCFTVSDTGETILQHKILRQDIGEYVLSHQPASIWKKDFLLSTIQTDVSPVDHECIVSPKLVREHRGEYNVYVVGSNPSLPQTPTLDQGEIIEYHHALRHGLPLPYYGKYA
jgi:hypothetical protein